MDSGPPLYPLPAAPSSARAVPSYGGGRESDGRSGGQGSMSSASRRVMSSSSIASSSAHSGRSHGSAGSGSHPGAAHMDSAVTKLLVATKQLLEGLTKWSQGKISEEEVSDIYVRLGNCFNAAVAAFTKEGISMKDLKEVPQKLRTRLEAAINEEASAATLEEHLPKIRPVILDLLRGLREKQDEHQAMLSARAERQRHYRESSQSSTVSASGSDPTSVVGYQQRNGSVSSTHSSASSNATATHHPQRPHPQSLSNSAGPSLSSSRSRESLRDYQSGRISPTSAAASQSRPSSRQAHNQDLSQHRSQGQPIPFDSQTDRSQSPMTTTFDTNGTTRSGPKDAPSSRANSLKGKSSGSMRPSGPRVSYPDAVSPAPELPLPPLPSPNPLSSSAPPRHPLPPVPNHLLSPPVDSNTATPPPPRPPQQQPSLEVSQPSDGSRSSSPVSAGKSASAFATPPRSSLRPSGHVKQNTEPGNDDAPLEALKKSDPLSRRASKRFSQYTFNKMASSTSMHTLSSPSGAAAGLGLGSLTPNKSSSSMERDDSAREFLHSAGRMDRQGSEGSPSNGESSLSSHPGSMRKKGNKISKTTSPRVRQQQEAPSVPALPPMTGLGKFAFENQGLHAPSSSHTGKKRVSMVTEETEDQMEADERSDAESGPEKIPLPSPLGINGQIIPTSTADRSLVTSTSDESVNRTPTPAAHVPPPSTVFLQLGRDMKKAKLDEYPPTLASLRMLFTNRFAYNPGLTDFPAIYLRDQASGVQYELEDMSEIKEHSVLSLNIEPLDQVKQHIDEGLASLARDLKELKSSIAANKRASIALPNQLTSLPASTPASSPPVAKSMPSDSQYMNAAEQVLQMKRKLSSVSVPAASEMDTAGTSHNVLSLTASTSSASEAKVIRLASELKSSHDEVLSVRRDVGTLRQVYLDFRAETTNVLSAIKTQTERAKDLAKTELPGDRPYVLKGKAKLENDSQDLLTKIEDLQDAIDDLKQDVTQRKIRPKPKQMEAIRASIEARDRELAQLGEWMSDQKPLWKRTWEAELQTIVDEQQMLHHQEELMADLKADHENVVVIFKQIEQYLDLKQQTGGRKTDYRPPSPRQGHEGLKTVMLEVKGLQADPNKRLEAIERAEQARKKAAEAETDDFQAELSGFVDSKMLKKTGGAEEAERIRQLKSDASLKAMFQRSVSPQPAVKVKQESPGPSASAPASVTDDIPSTPAPQQEQPPAPNKEDMPASPVVPKVEEAEAQLPEVQVKEEPEGSDN